MSMICALTLLLGAQLPADEGSVWRAAEHGIARLDERGTVPTTRAAAEDPATEDATAAGRRTDLHRSEPIPIPPPAASQPSKQPAAEARDRGTNVAAVVTSSLAIVLGLFFLVVWISRRALPKASASLPADVLEILGRSPLAGRHHLQLLRLGQRLLLISVTPDRAQTLAEISAPEEVHDLLTLCRKHQPASISATFRHVLHQLGSSAEESEHAADRRASRRRDETVARERDPR